MWQGFNQSVIPSFAFLSSPCGPQRGRRSQVNASPRYGTGFCHYYLPSFDRFPTLLTTIPDPHLSTALYAWCPVSLFCLAPPNPPGSLVKGQVQFCHKIPSQGWTLQTPSSLKIRGTLKRPLGLKGQWMHHCMCGASSTRANCRLL